jgi:probable phosphoglycerate mutase
MRLLLVRHGEAECNRKGIIGGHASCTGLTELGRQQARAVARYLSDYLGGESTGLWSSVLPRAVQTAEEIAEELGIPGPEQDCGLCELHVGEADGISLEELSTRFGPVDIASRPHAPLAPGAESWASFIQRATAALESLAERSRDRFLVVVTHGGVVQASMVSWLGLPSWGTRAGLAPAHCSITEWSNSLGPWRLIRYNFVPEAVYRTTRRGDDGLAPEG